MMSNVVSLSSYLQAVAADIGSDWSETGEVGNCEAPPSGEEDCRATDFRGAAKVKAQITDQNMY
jgi:hypothetical protein